MNDYIIEFENLSHEMNLRNISQADTVQTFKILEETTITDNQRQMELIIYEHIK